MKDNERQLKQQRKANLSEMLWRQLHARTHARAEKTEDLYTFDEINKILFLAQPIVVELLENAFELGYESLWHKYPKGGQK
jgi:hypothetical protein